MTIHTKHAPGTFSWAELATKDANGAKKFYGSLLGWTYEDMPAGPDMIYSMTKVGKEHASALYKMGESMKGIPPHWESYITVEDVDQAAKKAVANGGKVLKEPFDVMDVGRMAVVSDPTGAVFCLWTAKKHIGAGVLHDPGAMTWNELLTNDVEAGRKFYTSTFGWTTQAFDMGPMGVYTLFSRAGDAKTNTGGMMALGPEMKGAPSHWLVYFAVTDCDASAQLAKDLGGTVLSSPMDIPDIGRFAVIRDPQGAVFALYKGAH